MAVKDKFKQPRIRTMNTRRIREVALMLILLSLISYLFVSCGSDSKDPVGPVNPPDTGFEWTIAPPEEHGFDPALLDTLTDRINSGNLGRITSLLIARSGNLVYEQYFRGYELNNLVSIYSCTKSVTSALMGIAIGEESIGGVDDRLFDYLDGYTLFPPDMIDSLNREGITLEHLLTMTAGFSWKELEVPYGDTGNSYNKMVNSDNWIQFVLNQPIVSEPGTTFEYSTGLSGLMAVILENSTGQQVDDYAREKIFRHIGIDTCVWRMSPRGIPMTGSGLKLRPRDMAKFGWLYSQNGVWDGDTIVPSWWVQASHQIHSTSPNGREYGYQWWLVQFTDDQGNPFYMPYALGYGGQHIFVPPVYDMVIVVTADDDQNVSSNYILEIIDRIDQAFTP
ncbi:MAG: serine hydrolase [candidate division Zixibacteria bacterium]